MKNLLNFKGYRFDILKLYDYKFGFYVGIWEVKYFLQDFVFDWWLVKFIYWWILFDND